MVRTCLRRETGKHAMLKYTYGEAYIRKLHPKDKADSFMTAYRMSALKLICERQGKTPYVLVRRGFPYEVLEVDQTKAMLAERFAYGRTLRDACRWFRCKYPGTRREQAHQHDQ